MSYYVVNDTSLEGVANAIRTKGGTSESLQFPSGFVSAINAIETGGGSVSVVDTMTDLASTTEDFVLVLSDTSDFGTGGPCFFQADASADRDGYARTKGDYMFPMADQSPIMPSNAPIDQLTAVIKTWLDNTNVVHCPAYTLNEHGLFSTTVQQNNDGKWEMDCAEYVSAVLLGITYDNSRYVLGSAADNIHGEYIGENVLPPSIYQEYRPKGGLRVNEMSIWFGQQGRLFKVPEDPTEAACALQFGDILFGSETNSDDKYYGVEHVFFVLGTIPRTGKVIVTEMVDLTQRESYHEQAGAITSIWTLATYIDDGTFRIFARPNYGNFGKHKQALVPIGNGKFKYDVNFLPMSSVFRSAASDGSYTGAVPGCLVHDPCACATPEYLPAVPGSVISYTGTLLTSKGDTVCRVHEYDDEYKLLTNTTILYIENGDPEYNPVTIGSSTKYIRFTFGFLDEIEYGFCLADEDAFDVSVTLPTNNFKLTGGITLGEGTNSETSITAAQLASLLSGGMDGDDGITPEVTVTTITGGHNVAFSYGSGDSRNKNFNVMDGAAGSSDVDALIAAGTGNGTSSTYPAVRQKNSYTTASNEGAAAFNYATASGDGAFAEGYSTASGDYSHAEGEYCEASGFAAHAEGYATVASGYYSHADGDYTISNHYAQHVFGSCNVADDSSATASNRGNYIEIVGNGTGSLVSERSNARTLDWSGNEKLAGSLTLGMGTNDQTTITAAQLNALLLGGLPLNIFASNENKTHNGLTFTWSANTCTVSGTTSSDFCTYRFLDTDRQDLPGWLIPGDSYRLIYHSTNHKAQLIIYYYDDEETYISGGYGVEEYDVDTVITVPKNAAKVSIRLDVELDPNTAVSDTATIQLWQIVATAFPVGEGVGF